jgi:hypothetical protein
MKVSSLYAVHYLDKKELKFVVRYSMNIFKIICLFSNSPWPENLFIDKTICCCTHPQISLGKSSQGE